MVAITLLTDFGDRDGYVGMMKGVITGICPGARIIDLSHGISPQDVAAARFVLVNAYPYFPLGSIHVVVVDPGVGTRRRAIAVQTATGYLIGPDNGVLSGLLRQVEGLAAIALDQPQYWLTPHPSATFHGRDIFSPVAAHLAQGVPFSVLGSPISLATLLNLEIPTPAITDDGVTGHIQHIDQFGNLITTLPRALMDKTSGLIRVGYSDLPLGETYGEVPEGEAIAIAGSHGWIEIAVNGGSALAKFQLVVGDPIQLVSRDSPPS